jgi:bacteriocin-like protein
MERVMTTTNTFDLELTETELEQVVGGDTALQHETVHADLPNNGIQFGGGRTPVAITAILIGM